MFYHDAAAPKSDRHAPVSVSTDRVRQGFAVCCAFVGDLLGIVLHAGDRSGQEL